MQLDAIACITLLQLLSTAQAAVVQRQDLQALLIDAQGALLQPLAVNTFSGAAQASSRISTTTATSQMPINDSSRTQFLTTLTTTSTTSVALTSSAASPSTSAVDDIRKTTSTSPSPASRSGTSASSQSSTITSTSSAAGSLSTRATSSSTTTSTTAQPSSTKLVFAHHIIGNTYNYTQSSWANDISLASSKGIDAFALNIGSDSWEPMQVNNAYAAARSLNSTFKLFFSFDMTSFPCTTTSNAPIIRQYIQNYTTHPNQLLHNGKMFVSTFAGQDCTFGARSVDQGWTNTVKTGLNTYFVPSFFVDPATFKNYTVLDGAFGWNSGWPMGNYNITFDQDRSYISNLANRSYMAAASPWFFTHYGPDTYNKNFIYRGDDWLLAQRWEALVANRSAVDFVEVNTWNDFGESHYVGPIEGVQPMSQAWVNGFEHTGWLDLIAYYITAFKTGVYLAITRDRTYLWARLYPAAANATNDSVGRPQNWQWTQDYLWAVVQLTSPANVTLSCGNSSMTAPVSAGTAKLKLPLVSNCSVSSSISRGGNTTTFAPPGMRFSTAPVTYNFNAFVAASP